MSRKAIIDVGSNSIKFFVGELKADGTIETVMDTNDIARLGEGLNDTGRICPEAMERNRDAIVRFNEKAKELGADEIICVGTMALRTAKNSADFVAMVKDACGVEVQVIPGEEEARLSYLAVLSALPMPDGDLVIFDTGGGSTEFVFGRGKEIIKRFSVNLGAVRITENYLHDDPVTKADVRAAINEIDRVFAEHGVDGTVAELVGMGGTVTSMGAVKFKMEKYNPDIIQGAKLELDEVENQIEMYSKKTIEERKAIPGLQPKRADVILAGACILTVIMNRLKVKELTISDRGLRHGLAYDLFTKK